MLLRAPRHHQNVPFVQRRSGRIRTSPFRAALELGLRSATATLHVAADWVFLFVPAVDFLAGSAQEFAAVLHLLPDLHERPARWSEPCRRRRGCGFAAVHSAGCLGITARPDPLRAQRDAVGSDLLLLSACAGNQTNGLVPGPGPVRGLGIAFQVQFRPLDRRTDPGRLLGPGTASRGVGQKDPADGEHLLAGIPPQWDLDANSYPTRFRRRDEA